MRYDDYSDFGIHDKPEGRPKFKPAPALLLRANWGRGFRAPSLPEISPSSAFFFTTVTDPVPGGATVNMSGSIIPTRTWSPRKSRSFTAGIVFEPNSNFSVG